MAKISRICNYDVMLYTKYSSQLHHKAERHRYRYGAERESSEGESDTVHQLTNTSMQAHEHLGRGGEVS